MSAEIINFGKSQGIRSSIGHSIRTGELAYRQIEDLHAEGRLPANSVIIDASKGRFQKEFISALRESGSEIVLDTKAAELSEVGKFSGTAKEAPWSHQEERPLNYGDFQVRSNFDIFGQIARYAVELGATVVQAPTHFLREGFLDPWFQIDRKSVVNLRAALDREGGIDIAIDYPLILPHMTLIDGSHRRQIIQQLAGLPFDHLVVRLSGFGAASGPLTAKRTLIALGDLNQIGCPVVLDYVGGLVAVGAVAFGFVSGIAHGIGERERFDARSWHNPPKPRDSSGGFGRATYIPVPGFDRSFTTKDMDSILSAPGGRRLISCQNRTCCPQGYGSMKDKPKAHLAFQWFEKMDRIERIPDTRRAEQFLANDIREAERKARDLARLKVGDEKIGGAIAKGRKRIDSLARMFETLFEIDRPQARAIRRRSNVSADTNSGAQ